MVLLAVPVCDVRLGGPLRGPGAQRPNLAVPRKVLSRCRERTVRDIGGVVSGPLRTFNVAGGPFATSAVL
jgi:hypothetical protein